MPTVLATFLTTERDNKFTVRFNLLNNCTRSKYKFPPPPYFYVAFVCNLNSGGDYDHAGDERVVSVQLFWPGLFYDNHVSNIVIWDLTFTKENLYLEFTSQRWIDITF